MKENNNSNLAKKGSKIKTIAIVVLTNVVVIAAAIGIAFGVNAVVNKGPVNEEDKYTTKVDKETGVKEVYDENGKLMYKVNREVSAAGDSQFSRDVYTDKDNKTQKVVYYAGETDTIDRVDEYNENGEIAVQHEYVDGKDTGEYWKFDYNEDGKQTSSVNYDKDGKEIFKREQEYNKFGKPDIYVEKDAEGNIIAKTEYNYDKDGKETKTLFYDAEGLVGYVEYQYDKDGRVTRMDQYKDGKLYDFRTYTYDKNGVAKETLHQPDEAK